MPGKLEDSLETSLKSMLYSESVEGTALEYGIRKEILKPSRHIMVLIL